MLGVLASTDAIANLRSPSHAQRHPQRLDLGPILALQAVIHDLDPTVVAGRQVEAVLKAALGGIPRMGPVLAEIHAFDSLDAWNACDEIVEKSTLLRNDLLSMERFLAVLRHRDKNLAAKIRTLRSAVIAVLDTFIKDAIADKAKLAFAFSADGLTALRETALREVEDPIKGSAAKLILERIENVKEGTPVVIGDLGTPFERIMVAASITAAFIRLSRQWREETCIMSSLDAMVKNASYQSIIALGFDVLPDILRDLEREPDHWGAALTAITGASPVRTEDAGRLERIAAAWLAWAKEHGYQW